MSGSGTDKTKTGRDLEGPVVILVEPQLGENIGMAARAMGNFALTRLRIVKPRDGWPNIAAQRAAAGADHILDRAELFDTVEQATADLTLLFATTARAHDQAKPVVGPDAAAREIVDHVASGGGAGILFGRERYGLQNEEVALANRIITFPVNPGFASLNLAQAVLLVGYEWFKLSTQGALPFAMPERSERASQHQMQAFFENLVRELDKVEFLRPQEKRETMLVNLRNIFTRMDPTKQDMHTLHGVVMAIAEGRKGPAKGGVLDGAQATRLRALLAEQGQGGATADSSSTVRGLARLLRRNPTDAERILWQALTKDRRFAGQFKRQTPVGRHIPDFVSFVHRIAIELENPDESDAIVADRAGRKGWLEARGYRVINMRVADVERDLAAELDRLESSLAECRSRAGGARATARMAPRGSITVFLFTLGNSADKLAGLEQGKSQDAIRRIARSFYRDPIPLQLIEHLTQQGAAAVQSITQRRCAMATSDWRLEGEWIKNCSCAFGCPCDFNALPTQGYCKGLLGMRITKGHFEGTKLDGLIFAATVDFPGALHEGNGKMQPIIDERATPEQRQALFNILSGKNSAEGTLFQILSLIVTTIHDPLFVPFEFSFDKNGRVARLVAKGVLETEVEPIKNPVTGMPHRIQVEMPEGFEYRSAEVGSANIRSTGAIKLDTKGTHGSLANVVQTPEGVAA